MLRPPGGGFGGSMNKRGGSGMEIGIQTAQLLLDDRRRKNLQKKLKQEYPFVPDAILESCVELTANAFTQVAPDQLKIALKPGGMEKIRPELEKLMVDFACEQSIIQSIPMLDRREKRNLVKLLVTTSLDYVLRDAQVVLSSPEVRLEALEEQIREVKLMMGPIRLFWYRLRHNIPQVTTALLLSIVGWAIYQNRNVPFVAQTLLVSKSCGIQVATFLSIVFGHLWSVLLKVKTALFFGLERLWFGIGFLWNKTSILVFMLKKRLMA